MVGQTLGPLVAVGEHYRSVEKNWVSTSGQAGVCGITGSHRFKQPGETQPRMDAREGTRVRVKMLIVLPGTGGPASVRQACHVLRQAERESCKVPRTDVTQSRPALSDML